MPEIFLNFK